MSGYWRTAAPFGAVMIAILCYRVHEVFWLSQYLHPALIATYGGMALMLSRSSAAARKLAFEDQTFKIVLAYAAWMWVTVPLALWQGLAIQSALMGLPICASVLAILLCPPDRPTLRYLSMAFCVGALLLALTSLGIGATVADQGGERLTASGSFDSNDLAAAMAITIPIAIGVARRERGKRRLFAIAVALLFAAVIIKTGSRGGALALVAGALVFALGFDGPRKFYALAGLAALLSVGWVVSPPDFRARMQSLTNVEDDYNYTAYGGRKQIWKRGRGYIMEHPLTGVGVGNFPVAEGDYAAQLGRPAKWSAPHNAYLQAFAEMGIPGGLIFVAILFATAKRAWPMWKQTRSIGEWHRPEYLAALAAFAAGGYFLSQAYFYLLFGLCALIALADRARLLDRLGARHAASQGVARSAGWRTGGATRPRIKPTVA